MTPPDTYIHGHHDSVLRSHRWRTAENSAGYLLPHLRPGQALLDIGCGPGTITLDLAAAVAPGQTVGIDRAGQPLADARQAATDRGLTNVAYAVGDAYQLDFPANSFDVVHAHQVLQHLTDPVAALKEMARVCRPGGVVAARDADYAAMTWYPQDSRLDRWQQLYHQVAVDNGAEPDAGRRLLAWAHRAGYTDVSCSASVWCYSHPRRARVVGVHLGGASDGVGLRTPGGGRWVHRSRRAGTAGGGMAGLGLGAGRLVRDPARRDPLPGDVTPARISRGATGSGCRSPLRTSRRVDGLIWSTSARPTSLPNPASGSPIHRLRTRSPNVGSAVRKHVGALAPEPALGG